MKFHGDLDIYQRLSHVRQRMAAVFSEFATAIMLLSGLGLYLLYSASGSVYDFWMILLLFWLSYTLFAVLIYALGGKRVFEGLETLPPWKIDRRLEGSLGAALLASGMTDRVRLFALPSRDINSFSLSLPDGSFALFTTQGVSDKLPPSQREAIFAHEIAHMQAGDTFFHTLMIRLVGPGAFKQMERGWSSGKRRYRGIEIELPPVFAVLFLTVVGLMLINAGDEPSVVLSLLSILFLFAALAASLPFLMHKLLQLMMDRRREYNADMHAVYFTRDPSAVYNAVKSACEDVMDLLLLLLPSYLDALLFHPVVDFTSYRPFRTQPTMADRLEHLREALPYIDM